jgi:predicted ATPase/DNA-binding SARP family transcriptional activator
LDGIPASTDRRKGVALVAYLAVTGHAHTRDSLATLLWPDYDSSRAYAYLRRTLWEINDSLGKGWLDTARGEIGLDPKADIWLDVAQFRDLLASLARHGHPPSVVCPKCREPLEAAAALYRGDFLQGFSLRDSAPFDDWQRYVAEGLRMALGELLPRLVMARGQAREVEAALDAGRRWLALDPLNEEAHRQLMLLYALNNQLTAALRQYDDCVRLLEEELGVPPERRTTELAGRIKRREITPLLPAGTTSWDQSIAVPVREAAGDAMPVVASPGPDGTYARSFPLHNVPTQLTPFVGRTAELETLDRLLADPSVRLLSILAVGGMGKTRLAIEAAARAGGRMPHGVIYVSLAPLQSAASFIPTIAEALDLPLRDSTSQRDRASQKEQVLDFLRQKSLLLVMDNFEHLLEAVPWVHEILLAAPQVKVLVTSRLPLSLQNEHRYHLGGMDLPTGDTADVLPDSGAVKLFVQGARRAQPGFKLDQDDLAAVARICRLLHGMPLAILLAAGWAELLSPAEIAAEIEHSLDFLETTLHDVPERHRSLRPVLDHAWNLLSDSERLAYTRLSVFRGSFTRQAAQEVSGASLRELMSLVNKSLLQRQADGRFFMHELLRQEAGEKLAADLEAFETARDRHTAWFCRFLAGQLPAIKGSQQSEAVQAAELDLENFRLAWHWAAINRHTERLGQALEPLCLHFQWRWRYEEGRLACAFALDNLNADRADERILAGYALAWQAAFSMLGEHRREAPTLVERSLALLEQPGAAVSPLALTALAFAYRTRGWLAMWTNAEQDNQYLERSLALFQQAGDPWWCADVLQLLGFSSWTQDDLERTAGYFQQSLEIRRALRDQVGLAGLLNNLAALAGFDRGNVDESVALYLESASLYRNLGDLAGRVMALEQEQAAARLEGRFQDAKDLLQQQVAIARDLGDRGLETNKRQVLGEVLIMLGEYKAAHDEEQAVVSYAQQTGLAVDETWARWALSAALLGLGQYQEARAVLRHVEEQRELNQEQGGKTFFGRVLAAAGRAEQGLGHTEQAWLLVHRALALLADQHYFWLLEAMAAAAAVLAARGQTEQAVETYALLNRHAAVANSRWFRDVFGLPVEEAAATLPPTTRAAAQARGEAADFWQAARSLLVGA